MTGYVGRRTLYKCRTVKVAGSLWMRVVPGTRATPSLSGGGWSQVLTGQRVAGCGLLAVSLRF